MNPNLFNETSIEIKNEPIVLATLSIDITNPKSYVLLNGNIGWIAIDNGDEEHTDVIFELYRDTSNSKPIYSAADSGEVDFNHKALTNFTHVDETPISSPLAKTVQYILTAYTFNTDSVAHIVGPFTMTATEIIIK